MQPACHALEFDACHSAAVACCAMPGASPQFLRPARGNSYSRPSDAIGAWCRDALACMARVLKARMESADRVAGDREHAKGRVIPADRQQPR
jgi:hypothetical protein